MHIAVMLFDSWFPLWGLGGVTLAWMGVAVITFLFCLWVTQPYGRHTTTGWGPMMSNRWGWILQEAPSMIFLSLFFFIGPAKYPVNYFFLGFRGVFPYYAINRTFIFPLPASKHGGKAISR